VSVLSGYKYPYEGIDVLTRVVEVGPKNFLFSFFLQKPKNPKVRFLVFKGFFHLLCN